MEHLLSFANLRQIGLLVEQQPGEALTAVESKVGKLVNDKTAGKMFDSFIKIYHLQSKSAISLSSCKAHFSSATKCGGG